MGIVWNAPAEIYQVVDSVLSKHHSPRLDAARIAIAFNDSKPFVKNRFNWGKVTKFSSFNKIWQKEKFDFCLVVCADVWQDILTPEQKEALIDLHLTRCEVEYIPETITEGKKKQVVKDEWGRIQYTTEVKTDDEGNPKWYVSPLDINVFVQNVGKYGLWCSKFCEVEKVIPADQEKNEE